ncbi:YqcI/YcgG family protein, partial [Escherichia coli]|nr:YqcI/YcgG family protein [Escherichia coli]
MISFLPTDSALCTGIYSLTFAMLLHTRENDVKKQVKKTNKIETFKQWIVMKNSAPLVNDFNHFIESKSFCCIGARKAKSQNNLFHQKSRYPEEDLTHVYDFLESFALDKIKGKDFYSAIVFFTQKSITSEKDFEFFLWEILTNLNNTDKNKYKWANGYSKNTNDKNFSFSIAGEAFFVVGLHPMAHRISRRFNTPTLVFNHHAMFDKLKSNDTFDRYKMAI